MHGSAPEEQARLDEPHRKFGEDEGADGVGHGAAVKLT